MKVLHVISGLDPRAGGVVAAVMGLAIAQKQSGLEVHVASSFRNGDDVSNRDVLSEQGIGSTMIGPTRTSLAIHPAARRELTGLIRDQQVVHIHALWEDIQHQAARVCQRLGQPYLITPHGMLDPWSLSQGALKKKLYLALRLRRDLCRATALHFTAKAELDLIAPLQINTPALVEPNGIDLSEYGELPPEGTFRKAYPVLGDRRYILFLSRIHHKKGLELLLPAFSRLSPDVSLVIAGPGEPEYVASLKRMADGLGLGERVLFTGMIRGETKISALAEAELFVLCSHQENFGIVVAESLAAGTPVVISDQVNIHDAITAGGVGGVVPTDADALSEELARWLADHDLRAEAGARAKSFVREMYDWNNIADHWVGHYQRLING